MATNSQSPVVSIVIPAYNSRDLLAKNLPRLLKTTVNKKNRIKEIIVVDDGSLDGTAEFVLKNFSQVKLIKRKKNQGFLVSVNTGIRAATGRLIALINTDVIPSSNFLVNVIPLFNKRDVFAVSLNEGEYSWAKGDFVAGFIQHEPGPKTNIPHETFWVSGGSGVFRKDMLTEIGLFDEEVLSPFYWEDMDVCYRALKRGYIMFWEPNAKVQHKHESTINKKNFPGWKIDLIKERNQLLFIWKNITSNTLMKSHFQAVIARIGKHPGYLKVVLAALLNLRYVLPVRKREIKDCKLSDEAIFAKFENV